MITHPSLQHPPQLHQEQAAQRAAEQQFSFCGGRLCAQHQPQRWTTRDGSAGAEVLRLVETTQPRSAAK